MLVNNTPCGTPEQNLDYQSKSCFYGQGFDAKNASNVGTAGIGIFHGKFNDILGFRNLDTDSSMKVNLNIAARVLKFNVEISATPGNTLTLNPDGLFVPAGGGGGFAYTVVNVNTTPYTIVPITGVYVYLVDATAGAVTMNFPTAIGNTALYTIKKVDSSANTVILDPNGAQTLDGQATQTIRFQNTSVDIYSDNVNLYIR